MANAWTGRVSTALAAAAESLADSPRLAPIRGLLLGGREQLLAPLQVALVGSRQSGKTTLLHALLDGALPAPDMPEPTATAQWLTHGPAPRVTWHFKHGRASESCALNDEFLASHGAPNHHRSGEIQLTHIEHPHPLLCEFNVIDTPAQDAPSSPWDEPADANASRAGALAAPPADAVLLLFGRNLAAAECAAVEQFQGTAVAELSPLNAMGVLTRVDTLSSPTETPMAAGRRIVDRLSGHPEVRRRFHGMYPISGLLALGSQRLTAAELAALRCVADLPSERTDRALSHVERFARPEEDVAVPPEVRRRLWNRLGAYGLRLALRLLREGLDDAGLVRGLLDHSGVPQLRGDLLRHFGARGPAIKLESLLRRLRHELFLAKRRAIDATERAALAQVARQLERIVSEEHIFSELQVLRGYFQGGLRFGDEADRQLMAATGERGPSIAARLGQVEATPLPELLDIADRRVGEWRTRLEQAWDRDADYRDTLGTLVRLFEGMASRLRQALRLLEF